MFKKSVLLLAFALSIGSQGGALAQSQDLVIHPSEISVSPPAVVDSTYRFIPQINTRVTVQPKRPENPAPFRIPGGDYSKNSLPVGMVDPDMHRILAGPKFAGIDYTGWKPPDPTLAVGPSHVVITVNSDWAIFNKATGAMTFQQEFGDFFAGMGAGSFIFDPKVFYDPIADRFVMVVLEQDDATSTSKLLFAVSDDSDPNGTWHKYRIEAAADLGSGNAWFDYPGFGYNKDAYCMAGNMFTFAGNSFAGVQFIVIRKSDVLTGAAATLTKFESTITSTVQVAETFDPALATLYAVSSNGASSMRVWALRDLTTAPTLVSTTVAIPTNDAGLGEEAESVNGRFLDAVAPRYMNAVYRNGHVVTCQTSADSGDDRLRARWYEVNVNSWPTSGGVSLSQSGEVMGDPGQDFFMPAISQNSLNDIAIVFTRCSTSIVADIMTAGRMSGDPAGTMSAPVNLESSAAAEYDAAGSNRWGDYAGMAVDPDDDITFWCVHMNADTDKLWRTRFFAFTISSPAQLIALSISPSTVEGGVGTTGTVTLSAAAPPGGVNVTLSDNSGSITTPASVTVTAGNTQANFAIGTLNVPVNVTRQVFATFNGVTKGANLTIVPRRVPTNLVINPSSIEGGQSTTGTVTLSGVALPGGATVGLSSNSGAITVPASVTVPAGLSAASFNINTNVVGATFTRQVFASRASVTKVANLTLAPVTRVANFTASPTTVPGANNSIGTVTLNTAALGAGAVVNITTNSGAIFVPPTVTVPAGMTSVNFTIGTKNVGATVTRQVFASKGGVTRTVNLTINPGVDLTGLSVNPSTVQGGTNVTGTVAVSGPAPAPGAQVALSTNTSVVQVPAEVTVLTGNTFRQFTIVTLPVGTVVVRQIFATRGGVTKAANITLTP